MLVLGEMNAGRLFHKRRPIKNVKNDPGRSVFRKNDDLVVRTERNAFRFVRIH